MFQKGSISRKYECSRFQNNKGFNFESPEKKCHLDVGSMECNRVYYEEGNVVSSQRL
jgi:hypothetical protein